MSFEINLTIKSDEITATEVDSLTTLLNSFKGESRDQRLSAASEA